MTETAIETIQRWHLGSAALVGAGVAGAAAWEMQLGLFVFGACLPLGAALGFAIGAGTWTYLYDRLRAFRAAWEHERDLEIDGKARKLFEQWQEGSRNARELGASRN